MTLDDKLRDLHGELDRIGAPRATDEVESALDRVADALVEARVVAYRTLDEPTIRLFNETVGIKWPTGRRFWIRLHRHRSWAHSGLSDAERAESQAYLDTAARELGELFWDETRGLELEGRFR